MIKLERGFTLIEVAIFLAITGLLFLGVTLGVGNSLERQRETDATQGFIEFLRSAYSEVSNVQNTGGGMSDRAIYGKLITFGENMDLAGQLNEDGKTIFVYTVMGGAGNSSAGNVLTALEGLGANVVVTTTEGGVKKTKFAGIAESYTPRWGAQIEPACTSTGCTYTEFEGSILIVRHPNSGNTYTYYSPKTIEVNSLIKANSENPFTYSSASLAGNYLTDGSFQIQQVDFCVNASDSDGNTDRDNVRIIKGASNASGIELVPDDDEGNVCKR